MPDNEPPEEGVLVERGRFKVDRDKALEKLAAFALAHPERFLLFHIRAAAALRAPALGVERVERGLRVTFGGLPLSRGQLRDPYRQLLGQRTTHPVAYRNLARGLLGAFQAGMTAYEVVSGRGARRFRLAAASTRGEVLEAHPEAASDTVVTLRGGRWEGAALDRFLAAARGALELCPMTVRLGDETVPPRRPGPVPEAPLGGPRGARGFVTLPEPGAPRETRIDLYQGGVLAASASAPSALAGSRAAVEWPGLRLNASQSAALEGEVLEGVRAAVRAAEFALLRECLATLRARMTETGRRLAASPEARAEWALGESGEPSIAGRAARLLGSRLGGLLGVRTQKAPEPSETARLSRVAAWVRAAAERPAPLPAELQEPLRDAPVLFAADFSPLTLGQAHP